MCHALNKIWSRLQGEDNIKEGSSSIQEIITAQDKCLGDIADGSVKEGDI